LKNIVGVDKSLGRVFLNPLNSTPALDCLGGTLESSSGHTGYGVVCPHRHWAKDLTIQGFAFPHQFLDSGTALPQVIYSGDDVVNFSETVEEPTVNCGVYQVSILWTVSGKETSHIVAVGSCPSSGQVVDLSTVESGFQIHNESEVPITVTLDCLSGSGYKFISPSDSFTQFI
jgi:hypothetical protein